MAFAVFTAILAGVCISLYGWGLLLHRLTGYSVRNKVVTITIGLAIIIFLGGVFNLIRCAFGWVFDGLFVVGIVLAAKHYKLGPTLPRDKNKWFYLIIPGVIIAIIMCFTVRTQLPPKVFNWHDDFEKYFAHPVRMLQTGTLFGSPLSALGSETFGGQAVLHGIVLNHFPIAYINGADAVFGLFLCFLLSVTVVPLRAVFLPIIVISTLIVFFINPQYVNVSALYTGSAFMMAAILILSEIKEREDEKEENLPPPVIVGLIYAALIALKFSFAVFPLVGMIFYTAALGISGGSVRRLVRWCITTACSTFLFLLPWVLLYLPNYTHIRVIQVPHNGIVIYADRLNFLSNKPLFYGTSFAHYSFISIAIALPALGIVIWKRMKHARSQHIALAGLVASCATVVVAYLLIVALGPLLHGYEVCLRYSIPFLIAGAPIILSLVYLWAILDKSFGFKLTFSVVPLLFGTLILIIFSHFLAIRVREGYERGSILAFSKLAAKPDYIRYNEEVINGNTRLQITAAQKQIPPGQAAIIWVSTPFYLDYKRNVIYDAEPAGIAGPWAYLPDADYFMLQYRGPAVQTVEMYAETVALGKRKQYLNLMCVEFLKYLQEVRENSDELYNDGQIVVFKKHGK